MSEPNEPRVLDVKFLGWAEFKKLFEVIDGNDRSVDILIPRALKDLLIWGAVCHSMNAGVIFGLDGL